MKLKEHLEFLQKLVKEHPEYLDYNLITSGDDEGNYFNKVYFSPSVGCFDDDEREWLALSDYTSMDEDEKEDCYMCEDFKTNAICIN